MIKKRLALLLVGFFIALGIFGAVGAQTTNQIITTLLGSELIQVYPANTANIAYTTVSSMRDGRGYQYAVPTTGNTVTMTVAQSALSLNPAATLAALTVLLPPTAIDGKTFSVWTSQTITALTLTPIAPAGGTTPTIQNAPTSLTGGATAPMWIYDAANNVWHRIE